MKKMTLPLVAFITVILMVVIFRSGGPNLKQFARLTEPGFTNIAAQRMLSIELKGDPSRTAGEAFSLLYKNYFKLKTSHRSFRPVAARARWTGDPKDRTSWTGVFAIPVADDVTALPPGADSRLRLETWAYGATAEILHKGAYTNERQTVEKLLGFVKEKGFKVVGEHEEEYLTMPSSDASRMFTIIRYRVEKTGR